jgi:hypothetical protein
MINCCECHTETGWSEYFEDDIYNAVSSGWMVAKEAEAMELWVCPNCQTLDAEHEEEMKK